MGLLEGSRILVTRDEGPDGSLCALLRREGALPLLRPTLEVVPLAGPEERADAIRRLLPGSGWLLLTSPRAVTLLREAGIFADPPPPALRVAVAGVRTGDAVREAGWPVAVTPPRAGGAPLLEAILGAEGGREDGGGPSTVVFPASAHAADTLPDGLRAAGYRVEVVPLYAPRLAAPDPAGWRALLREAPDAVTFSSPSAVDGLLASAGNDAVLERLRSLPAAVQGPTTGAAARRAGWSRVAEAEPRTFPGLVRALETLLNHATGVPE